MTIRAANQNHADFAQMLYSRINAIESIKRQHGNLPHYEYKPLSKVDTERLEKAIETPIVANAMQQSWAKTLASGDEFSFFIYHRDMSYYVGPIWHGTKAVSNSRQYYEYITRHVDPIFNYHTHPGKYPAAAFPSDHNLKFNRNTKTIGILQTRFGITFG